jgi:LCP family protein required for cell wall assembly
MKLSGNKKNGRYTAGKNGHQATQANHTQRQYNGTESHVRKKKKSRRAGKILITLVVVIIALGAVLFTVYKLGVRPPKMESWTPPGSAPSVTPADGESAAPQTVFTDRKGTQYTFAILGMDDGNGNTDTIMVANFDVDNHKLNVVNIPRDTLINVKWNTKKANTLFANGEMDGVRKGLSDLGIHIDFYIRVDLKAFSALVNAIDGVYFDVPKDMNYEDPAQDLYIHLNAGPQQLDGEKALQLVRCRSVYANADIGRIETQQAFLKVAAEQILANQKKLDITELAGIFLNYVKTDLDLGEVVWLGKEFYKMDAANVSFEMIPANYYDTVNNTSYCTINVGDWLKLLNEKINPFRDEIKAEDVSILTRGANGDLYVTNGVWAGKQSWGSGGNSGSNGGAASPSPKPSTPPSPSPSPSNSPSPSPSDSTPPSESPSGEDISPDISPTEPEGEASPSPSDEPSPDVSPSPTPSPEDSAPPSESPSTP